MWSLSHREGWLQWSYIFFCPSFSQSPDQDQRSPFSLRCPWTEVFVQLLPLVIYCGDRRSLSYSKRTQEDLSVQYYFAAMKSSLISSTTVGVTRIPSLWRQGFCEVFKAIDEVNMWISKGSHIVCLIAIWREHDVSVLDLTWKRCGQYHACMPFLPQLWKKLGRDFCCWMAREPVLKSIHWPLPGDTWLLIVAAWSDLSFDSYDNGNKNINSGLGKFW